MGVVVKLNPEGRETGGNVCGRLERREVCEVAFAESKDLMTSQVFE